MCMTDELMRYLSHVCRSFEALRAPFGNQLNHSIEGRRHFLGEERHDSITPTGLGQWP